MPRAGFFALSCVTMVGLSCAIPKAPPAELPPVGANAEPTLPTFDGVAVESIARRFGSVRQTGMTRGEIGALAQTIVREAQRHDIDPALVVAVIHVESRYDAFIVSHAGAMGLMQILPTTGEEVAARLGIPWRGPQTLFDPIVNVKIGVAYLKELSDRYGDTGAALAAYNWGPGHIDRRLRRGSPLPKIYPQLVFDAYSDPTERSS
ncbi:MAG: lytic transglycosylase domain-containing protein [Myxococcota bacterium]